jgi:glycosyltransferase involved in cell wall biosynthesis
VPRRILLLITDLEIGGTPTVVRELAIRLNDPPDVEVEVACLKKWGPVADQLRDAGVGVTAFDASRVWHLPVTVRKLRELVRERNIDTVFSFLLHANAVATMASREMPGVRFLQSIQTIQPNPRWHWWLQRRIHHAAEKVVGPSTAIARLARDVCGIPSEKFVVIPNAVDPSKFPRVAVFAEPRRIRIGFLGRLDAIKNVPYWVRSVCFAGRDDVRVEGHIFGDGPDRPEVETTIRDLKAQDRVILHGTAPNPPAALAQMDLLFLPSLGEGFGLVLIEAMASGVPVVAFAAGGVTDILKDNVNGFLIAPEIFGHHRLGPIVDKLRADPALRQRVIENALATVREKFTWSTVLPQYRRLIGIDRG